MVHPPACRAKRSGPALHALFLSHAHQLPNAHRCTHTHPRVSTLGVARWGTGVYSHPIVIGTGRIRTHPTKCAPRIHSCTVAFAPTPSSPARLRLARPRALACTGVHAYWKVATAGDTEREEEAVAGEDEAATGTQQAEGTERTERMPATPEQRRCHRRSPAAPRELEPIQVLNYGDLLERGEVDVQAYKQHGTMLITIHFEPETAFVQSAAEKRKRQAACGTTGTPRARRDSDDDDDGGA